MDTVAWEPTVHTWVVLLSPRNFLLFALVSFLHGLLFLHLPLKAWYSQGSTLALPSSLSNLTHFRG